jgi:hypothetical protein
VIYPGSTPVGNATLVVANVLTCNKHSQNTPKIAAACKLVLHTLHAAMHAVLYTTQVPLLLVYGHSLPKQHTPRDHLSTTKCTQCTMPSLCVSPHLLLLLPHSMCAQLKQQSITDQN